MASNWFFWLILISAIAIIIRSLPGWLYAAWGCDFGIYYQISSSVAKNAELFPVYQGWGSSYNEFPVLYAITAFFHWITGIDVIVLMPKLIPIFGGLSVTIFYFLVEEIWKNKKIALVSALFLTVLYFHPYQTSHAAPLTMGHFFMIMSLYLFVKYRKNIYYSLPLIISTILLIMSHHFTTYIFLISVIGIIFFENYYRKDWTVTIRRDIVYILFASGLTFIYWALVARTVYESFMATGMSIAGFTIPSHFILIGFYALFFLLFGIIHVKRKMELSEKKWQSAKDSIIIFTLTFTIIVAIMFIFLIFNLPWTNFKFNTNTVVLSIPFLIFVALAVTGFRYTRFIKNGFFVRGWLIIILFSLFYGLIRQNGPIIPERHFEYLMYPMSIIAVIGLGGIFSDPFYKGLLSKLWKKVNVEIKYNSNKIRISQKSRRIHAVLVAVLVISSGVFVYSSFEALQQAKEEITDEDINLIINWLQENLDKNESIIASDHRLERMVEAEGFNTTKDEAVKIWGAENLSDYIDELYGIGRNYSKITHVIIDDIMKYDVVHIGYKKPGIYMTNETWTAAYDKFKYKPFELVYRNESADIDPVRNESASWAEIYRVNWTYLEILMKFSSYFYKNQSFFDILLQIDKQLIP